MSWNKVAIYAVGGLREIGFVPNREVLMVLSGTGRGLLDTTTGTKVGRDPFDYYLEKWDEETGIVEGFGEFEKLQIPCGGFEAKNVLDQETSDGWEILFEWKRRRDFRGEWLRAEVMYLMHFDTDQKIEVMEFHYGIDRGYGFSHSGQSFVIGTSSEVYMWTRL